ncbi:hypothetical protein Sde_0698 [Saccharophagus degradans 2-40]|uniref:Uncharacterized protein n=2 Tax=Saccharophagus degradans TaxID=86304 RepID=Q21MW9_SACD2|nr:hypothetical protein Sde_0698 [Saccharophagus degradans 2-40]
MYQCVSSCYWLLTFRVSLPPVSETIQKVYDLLDILFWIGKIFLFCMVAYVIFGIGVFIMFNIAPRTERKVRRNANNKVLVKDATLTERATNMQPWDNYYSILWDKSINAQDAVLQDNNTFVVGSSGLEQEQSKSYLLLTGPYYTFAFKDKKLFWVHNGVLAHEEKAWGTHNFTRVTHAAVINANYMLVEAAPPSQHDHQLRHLYQVNVKTLEAHKLESTPYYTFDIPPKRFVNESTNTTVLVYYHDSYSYAFGGDSSRPQTSIVRLYNNTFPEGKDIANISFAAGMVIDVAFEEGNKLVLLGDPSRPAMYNKPRLAPRVWVLTLPTGF